MVALRVAIRHGANHRDIDFPDDAATLGDVRNAIEQQMCVPKDKQTLICSGKRWQGIAFPDSLKLLDAAGPKGVKDVDGVKVVTLMLMAPAGLDQSDEISKFEASVDEARSIIKSLPAPDAESSKKASRLAHDLLVKASAGLDSLSLVGAQREARRALLGQIEALEQELDSKKAKF
eukprot:TRINITY_DN110684_c0_g1_i1.p1 TRINITY_DN110684_c0_g1~~TRINITY_DN110684_c0_g1_i1.p1  ORF type:complete len:176 (+),score=36.70 TRINITY_DN110684_c0_g1_i1:94-621(+)